MYDKCVCKCVCVCVCVCVYAMLCSTPYSWVPVYSDSSQQLAVMSIGFLLKSQDDAVVWRGPKKNGKHW